jgi:YegS/Rv2252/BmrU family lipid kinase
MKTRVIVNPMAAKGSAGRRWPQWRHRLEAALGPLDVVFTAAPGDATNLARAAVASGCRRVIAAGGDGTANEALNGLVTDGRMAVPDAVLCPVPLGTANELCRALGYPPGPEGAIRVIAAGRTRAIDVIRCDFTGFDGRPATRCGYLVASFGGAATISRRASASPWLKKLGQVAYFLMTPVVAMTCRPQPVGVRIDDAPPLRQVLFTGMVASTRNAGGGMILAPGAVFDDGLLDFVAFGALTRGEILFRVMPGIRRGRHVGHPKVSVHRGRIFHFGGDGDIPVDIDGEAVGILPLQVTVLHRALNVPAPSGAA